MPTVSTVMRWLIKDEDFREQYRESREIQADSMFDELIDIADSATPEDVNVAKLQIWARQWFMGKINAKKYGEKASEINNTVNVQNITVIPAERMKELQEARREALGE